MKIKYERATFVWIFKPLLMTWENLFPLLNVGKNKLNIWRNMNLKKTVQIGRNQIQKVPDFDSEEVRCFQKMAQLIDSKGLEQTIFEVWGNAQLLTLEHIQDKHNRLVQAFINYRLQTNKQIDFLKKKISH